MAITIRVPDPTEDYDVSNQRQIVRAVNNFIQQIIPPVLPPTVDVAGPAGLEGE